MNNDDKFLGLICDALDVCARYRPKFGRGGKSGVSLDEFQGLYQRDPLYNWFGLDSPLVYAAHKAAGGMTSVYRQIGMACEWVFQAVLQDTLGLASEQAKWSYTVPSTTRGKERTLSLDGRIPLAEIRDTAKAKRVRAWLDEAASRVKLSASVARRLKGSVFEVRQGYKSKDSKRQNADIANAANAYANQYLPVLALFSIQIDDDIAERYVKAQWLLLRGSVAGSSIDSTYAFSREVLGYDLAAFFERTSPTIKRRLQSIMKRLLQ